MKETAIEEAAANLADPNVCKTDNWIAGAKWMQEQMTNKERLLELVSDEETNTIERAKQRIAKRKAMKIDQEEFNRKAQHIIETVVKPQVAKYEQAKAKEMKKAIENILIKQTLTVGGYKLGNTTLTMPNKPKWIHRKMMKIFFGVDWVDSIK